MFILCSAVATYSFTWLYLTTNNGSIDIIELVIRQSYNMSLNYRLSPRDIYRCRQQAYLANESSFSTAGEMLTDKQIAYHQTMLKNSCSCKETCKENEYGLDPESASGYGLRIWTLDPDYL